MNPASVTNACGRRKAEAQGLAPARLIYSHADNESVSSLTTTGRTIAIMGRKIETEIEIQAAASAVWDALTDFAAWPEWNPFIVSFKGEPEIGSRIEVEIEPPGGRLMRFRPIILVWEPGRALIWKGSVIVAGLFDGEHRFEVEAVAENVTRFVHAEKFSGILVPLIWRSMEEKTRAGFKSMNQALKDRVENGP